MALSALKRTPARLKFWFIKNYMSPQARSVLTESHSHPAAQLSALPCSLLRLAASLRASQIILLTCPHHPQMKAFVPYMARKYGFDYE